MGRFIGDLVIDEGPKMGSDTEYAGGIEAPCIGFL